MYKEYDGDGIETPVTYNVVESYTGEVRDAILEQFCFDTAIQKEYDLETENGEATVITREWLSSNEIAQLELISEFASDEFFVDITKDSLNSVLASCMEVA